MTEPWIPEWDDDDELAWSPLWEPDEDGWPEDLAGPEYWFWKIEEGDDDLPNDPGAAG